MAQEIKIKPNLVLADRIKTMSYLLGVKTDIETFGANSSIANKLCNTFDLKLSYLCEDKDELISLSALLPEALAMKVLDIVNSHYKSLIEEQNSRLAIASQLFSEDGA